jgi:hypothetical protein
MPAMVRTRDSRRRRLRRLLAIDASCALLGGTAMLFLSGPLSDLHGLSANALRWMAAASFCFGAYSSSLWCWRCVEAHSIRVLAGANLAWAGLCLYLLSSGGIALRPLGFAHLLIEALFVGALGAVEAASTIMPALGSAANERHCATAVENSDQRPT